MNRSVISGLIITTALLASPAFADDKDLCSTNLTALESFMNSTVINNDAINNQLKEAKAAATAAQAKGDYKTCVNQTLDAKEAMKSLNQGGKG